MVNVFEYQDIDSEVLITFTDEMCLIGRIDSVDDEEESELGEPGLSVFTRDGMYLGLGQSEIECITVLETSDAER